MLGAGTDFVGLDLHDLGDFSEIFMVIGEMTCYPATGRLRSDRLS